jgi:hypothetical protein
MSVPTATTYSAGQIGGEILKLAALDGRSLAARVRPTNFDEVVMLIGKSLAPEWRNDIEVSVLGGLARVHASHRDLFLPLKPTWRNRRSGWNDIVKKRKET